MHRLREGSEHKIFQLDGVVGQCVHEVEVEIAEELGIVLEDDKHDVHRCGVEASHGSRGLLTWHEVGLDEGEAVDEQVFHLVESLQLVFELVNVALLR